VNSHINDTDEIDIREILSILQRGKKTIVYGSLIGTLLLIGVLLLWPKSYESKAVLSLGTINTESIGINIPLYRSFDNVFSNSYLFADYLSSADSSTNWQVYDKLISNSATPIYGYDEKSTVRIDDNSVLGLRLTCLAGSPDIASKRVVLMGDYIETVMLNIQLWNYIDNSRGSANTDLADNNSAILQSKFKIENLKEKGELLESKFLSSEAIKSTFEAQIVQVDEVTEKYLSPQQQLVSVKVSIKNNEIGVRSLERKIKKNEVTLDYLSKIEVLFDSEKHFLYDTQLLDKVSDELNNYFSKFGNNDPADEAYYTLAGHFNRFLELRNAQYKFVSGPTRSDEWVKPKIQISTFIGLLIFTIFFSIRAIFLEWWKPS